MLGKQVNEGQFPTCMCILQKLHTKCTTFQNDGTLPPCYCSTLIQKINIIIANNRKIKNSKKNLLTKSRWYTKHTKFKVGLHNIGVIFFAILWHFCDIIKYYFNVYETMLSNKLVVLPYVVTWFCSILSLWNPKYFHEAEDKCLLVTSSCSLFSFRLSFAKSLTNLAHWSHS